MYSVTRSSSFERVPARIGDSLLAGLVALLPFPERGPLPLRKLPIGPGDVLKTTVYGHEDLTRSAVVAADGRMPSPLIGEIQVTGLTQTERSTSRFSPRQPTHQAASRGLRDVMSLQRPG